MTRDLKERVRAIIFDEHRHDVDDAYTRAYLRGQDQFVAAFQRHWGRLPSLADLVRAEVDGWELPQEPGDNWPHEGAIMWRRRAEELRRCAR